ncbi:hypothetical protein BDZ97DRAFT_1650961 [Flammula alnicola]|nr:hypothetical protein BDZ97DRAFT_1650961 [Flammula alnicola]
MSGCPHANTSQSSQDFVRALKAVSDPPVLGGPSKIEIAQEAWDDINFYVPSKAEVIADWLLAKLLKDKGKELPSNPIFDARYWKLLTSLSSSQGPTPKTNNVGPAKSWLTTSLHRVPLGPVIVSFLTSFNDVQANERINLANSAASCLSILWPVAVQRMSAEVLQECFGAFVCKVPASKTANEGISTIGCMVSSSYRNSLINSSNKKKLYQSFLHSHLKDWLRSFSMDCTILDATLKSSLLDSGVETFFNLDILRQNLDFKTENTLVERLQSILTTDETLVLEHLPTLFIFYIHAIKRHRGALFSQSSQFQPGAALGELREAGMRYFISMLNLVDNSRRDSQAWRTRLSLLKTVDNENIFDRKQMDTQMAFNRIIELVQLALIHDLKEDQPECPDLAVQCLSIIAHIDYDLVLPFIPRLLPLFLQIPVASESHFAFLEMVLHYHTKTRTMATLVQSLFISILAQKMFRGGPHGGYQMCFSSPVMHTIYLAQVSKALQTFLTESQCLLAVQTVFDALRDTWDQFYTTSRQSEEAGESRKRRKTSSATVEVKGESDEIAVVYSLIARLASVVLSSLPIASLSSTIQDEVRSLLDGFRTDFICHALSKSIKTIRKHGVADAWRTEVTFAATLRLLYSLNVSRILSLPPQYDEKLCTRVVELVNDDALLPELMLELFRFLLYSLSVENTLNHEVIVDRLLQYLEKNFAPSDVNWSGHGHHLTKGEPGRTESALAMMPMIIARWLPEIDRLASSEQLERLLKIILSIKMHPAGQSRQEMQPEQLLMEVLHSAQFWEFPRIRNVFLDILDKTTSALDSTHLKLPKTISILEKVSLYQHLLFFPMEYFSWQLLNDLIKRSLNADVVLSCSSSSSKQPVAEALIVLRVFLKRAYVYCGSVAQDSVGLHNFYLLPFGSLFGFCLRRRNFLSS